LHCPGSAAGTNFSPAAPHLTLGVHTAPKEPQGNECWCLSPTPKPLLTPELLKQLILHPSRLPCAAPLPLFLSTLPVQLCCCSAWRRAAAPVPVPQPSPCTLLLPQPNAAPCSLPAATEPDELNPAPVTCFPPSSRACLGHGVLCGSGRGEERAGERAGAGSVGEHAGGLGWISTGAYGSWEPSTGCTENSVTALHPLRESTGSGLRCPAPYGRWGCIHPAQLTLGVAGGTKPGGGRLQPGGTARTPARRGWGAAPLPRGEGAVRHGWAEQGEEGSGKGAQKGEVRQKSHSCVAVGGRGTGKRQTRGRASLTAGGWRLPASSPSSGVRREGSWLLASQALLETSLFSQLTPGTLAHTPHPFPSRSARAQTAGRATTQPFPCCPTLCGTLGGWRPGRRSWHTCGGCANGLRHVPDPPSLRRRPCHRFAAPHRNASLPPENQGGRETPKREGRLRARQGAQMKNLLSGVISAALHARRFIRASPAAWARGSPGAGGWGETGCK